MSEGCGLMRCVRGVWPDGVRGVWPDGIRGVWPDECGLEGCGLMMSEGCGLMRCVRGVWPDEVCYRGVA